jgi:16S rRNA (adenine(1408)-N(1))-methyltransferase
METAWKAGRKPARGGVPNLICIAEPLHILAAELGAVADRITVILPWGELLHAVAAPDLPALQNIAALCLSHARIEIVFSYDPDRDGRNTKLFGSVSLDDDHISEVLPPVYEQAGLEIIRTEKMANKELAQYETAWAKRLAFGRSRDIRRMIITRV